MIGSFIPPNHATAMDDAELNNTQPETGHDLREHTEGRRADAGGPEIVASQVKSILEYIDNVGLDLTIFLDAVCWGNDCLVADGKVKYERSALMHSNELPRMLERWEKKSP